MAINLPYLTRPLMVALDAMFPAACPDPRDTEREIWMKAGERRAVEKIELILKHQESKSGIS